MSEHFGSYIGSRYPHLVGERAMLLDLPKTECFMVQFNNRSLTLFGRELDYENGYPDPADPPLAFGMWPFPRSDFSVDAEPVAGEPCPP